MNSYDEIVCRLKIGFELGNLFENAVVEFDSLPNLIPETNFLSRVLGIKFFAFTFNGVVKQLSVPCATIPYPRSVIAALSTSPDSPVHDPADQQDVVAVLHAIETLRETSDVSDNLGVNAEDFRLCMSYRSETGGARIVHYPLSEDEKLVLRNKLENFLVYEIQNWLVEKLPQGHGPVCFFRPKDSESVIEGYLRSLLFGGTEARREHVTSPEYVLLKDVLNLLATTSSNRVVRELASGYVVSAQPSDVGWGIRQRRRAGGHMTTETFRDPIGRKLDEIYLWAASKTLIDQTIVMHDFDIFSKSQKNLIFSVFESFLCQKKLIQLNESCKKTISSSSTRAPPSLDDVTDIPFTLVPRVPESLTIANLNHQIEILKSQLDSHNTVIGGLQNQLAVSRATIRSKDHIIAELTNHCVRMKAHLFAYSDELEDGSACDQYEYAKLWTEIEKLRIEKNWIMSNSRTGGLRFSTSGNASLKIRDEIIDLLNFVIVRITGGQQTIVSEEVGFAVAKIRDLMKSKEQVASGEEAQVANPTPPPTDSDLLDQYTNTYFP